MNVNQDPARPIKQHFFERGELQLRQPYVRLTGFRKEAPQLPCAAVPQANKGGHHGCTLEKYGFSILSLSIILRSLRCFSALQSWMSAGSSSEPAKHSASSRRPCRSSGIVDFALGRTSLDSMDDLELLVSEWDRENCLWGGVKGKVV